MTPTPDPPDLDALAAVVEKMTAEPWKVRPVQNESGDTLYHVHVFVEPSVCGMWWPIDRGPCPNAAGIAALRNAARWLITEARAAAGLRERVTALEESLRGAARRMKAQDGMLVAHRLGSHRAAEKHLADLAATAGVPATLTRLLEKP